MIENPREAMEELRDRIRALEERGAVFIKAFDLDTGQWFWLESITNYNFGDSSGGSEVVALELRRQK